MVNYKERQERTESVGRIRELLRGDEHNVTMSRADLLELARHHPEIKWDSSIPRTRRKNGYWKTTEGHKEARAFVAGYYAEHNTLPNSTGFSKAGIGNFLQSNGIISNGYYPTLRYVKFLHEWGYSVEQILTARLSGFVSAKSIENAIAPLTPRHDS